MYANPLEKEEKMDSLYNTLLKDINVLVDFIFQNDNLIKLWLIKKEFKDTKNLGKLRVSTPSLLPASS